MRTYISSCLNEFGVETILFSSLLAVFKLVVYIGCTWKVIFVSTLFVTYKLHFFTHAMSNEMECDIVLILTLTYKS